MIQELPVRGKQAKVQTNVEPVYHLTEICSNGFVRNYGSESLRGRSKIIIRPHATTEQMELLVDELIYEILPSSYRNIYFPSRVRSSGQVTKLPPSKVKEILSRLQICQSSAGNNQSVRHNILQILEV